LDTHNAVVSEIFIWKFLHLLKLVDIM
jgi:hypothetical protein